MLGLVPGLAVGQFVNGGTSLNPVGSGARAMGQGNAFIAVADDATAASWNPAGLTQLEKPELSLALQAVDSHGEVHSDLHPESESATRADSQDLNYFSAVVPFRLGGHAVASLNYLTLFRFEKDLEFPWVWQGGAPRQNEHHTIEQEGALSAWAPALAVDVTDRLALGAAFLLWSDELTGNSAFRRKESTYVHSWMGALVGEESMSYEDRFEISEGYSLNLGAMYRLSRAWTVAAVVKPAFTLDAEHTIAQTDVQTGDLGTWPYTYSETAVQDADIEFPTVLGAGAAWRPSDAWTVSADATWTQWSEYKVREADREVNPVSNRPLADGACRDTTTVRLGAEYVVIRERYLVPLRCGVGYDPGPAVEEVDEYWTGSLGVGLQWSRYALDFAYEARYGHDVGGAMLPGIGTEDTLQHRLLLSLILYL